MGKLRVFTAFSGYDSQCMALERAGIDYDLIGWSEIDPYAIRAHDAVFPQFAGRNYGDISKIDWESVPDFDLFTYSSPCQDFSNAGRQAEKKGRGLAPPSCGNAGRRSGRRGQSTLSLRMSRISFRTSSIPSSVSGSSCLHPSVTSTIGRYSTQRTTEYRRTGNGYSWSPSWKRRSTLSSPLPNPAPSVWRTSWSRRWMRNTTSPSRPSPPLRLGVSATRRRATDLPSHLHTGGAIQDHHNKGR